MLFCFSVQHLWSQAACQCPVNYFLIEGKHSSIPAVFMWCGFQPSRFTSLQFQSLRERCLGLNTGCLRLGTCRECTSCSPREELGCQAPWVNGGTTARKGIAYCGRGHVGSCGKWNKRDFRLDSMDWRWEGMVSGWFKCITFIVHFISVIVTSASPHIIRH